MLKYLLLLVLLLNAVRSTTYYVAIWGNDSNPGTIARPWRNINKAATTMMPNDSVLIRAGIYKEGVNPVRSGTPGLPITYANYNNEEVIVEGGEEISDWTQDSGNRYRATVNFTPSPRFTSSRDPRGNLGGLVLQDGAKMNYAMAVDRNAVDTPGEYFMNDSAGAGPPYTIYVYVRDLGSGYDPNNYQMIVGRFRKGFDLDGGEDIIIVDGLAFRDYNDNAIHSIGSNSCEFKNLKLYSNFITGIYLTSNSRNNTIEKCIFWDNGHGGIELAQSHSTIVRKNKFTGIDLGNGLGGNGAHIWLGPLTYYSDSCLLENNIGFRTGSDYLDGPYIALRGSNTIIRHNSGINFGSGGIALLDGANNIVINNAVDCNRGVACVNVFPDAVRDSGHFIQFNDFYAQDPTGRYRWDGVVYNSLNEWEIASRQLNNIDAVPGFAQPDSEDLHLIPGSACIDAGTANNASTEDYEGNPRPQGGGYDIGAFEFLTAQVDNWLSCESKNNIILIPNPARQGIWIRCLPLSSKAKLRIYDLGGRLVKIINLEKNQSQFYWDGHDDSGFKLPSGNYYLVYTVDSSPIAERKIILLR